LQPSAYQTEKIAHYFYEKTRKLIISKSFTVSDKGVKVVDIVRDVLRYVPLYWTATQLAGLTLKADEQSPGDYTESQLYKMVTDIYSFLFLDVDPSKAMNIEERVKGYIKDLRRHIKANILSGRVSPVTPQGLVFVYSHSVLAFYRRSGRYRPIFVHVEGEET